MQYDEWMEQITKCNGSPELLVEEDGYVTAFGEGYLVLGTFDPVSSVCDINYGNDWVQYSVEEIDDNSRRWRRRGLPFVSTPETF